MQEVIALKHSFLISAEERTRLKVMELKSNNYMESYRKMADFISDVYSCVQRLEVVDKLYDFPYSLFGEILRWSISQALSNQDLADLSILLHDFAAEIAASFVSQISDQISNSLLRMDRGPFICAIHILKDLYLKQNMDTFELFKEVIMKLSDLKPGENHSILSWLQIEAPKLPITECARNSIIAVCEQKCDWKKALNELILSNSDPITVTLIHAYVYRYSHI
jgi:hypothetical protein